MSETYVSDSNLNLNINDVSKYLLESFAAYKEKRPEIASELFKKTRTFQQDLIYTFLDHKYESNIDESENDYENELIDEAFGLSRDKFRDFFANVKNALKQLFNSDNLTDEQKFALTVIEKNLNNCNRICSTTNTLDNRFIIELIKTDESDIINYTPALSNYLTRLQKSNQNLDVRKIGKCLRFCYLDYMTSIYAEGIISFETCKSNASGQNMRINTYTDILKNYPIDSVCSEIFVVLNDLYTDISKLLDFIYSKDSFKIKRWTDVIDEKIRAFRQGRNYVIDFTKIDDEFEYPNDNVRVV